MGRGPSKKGIEARQRILAELARRWREVEAPPTWIDMMAALGMSSGNLDWHIRKLRSEGLVHPGALWITRAGLDETDDNQGLTFQNP